MRWPFMTKATHDRMVRQLNLAHETCTSLLQDAINQEYARATADGRAKVHAWAIDANFNVFSHANPRGAAQAAFQEAERVFRPEPITIKEVLEGAQ